ncbi:MAG: DUF4102 domain-containing protein [Ferrovum sp.]|nr:DUF4102 domain-containing protein [Ferrovum sp.]
MPLTDVLIKNKKPELKPVKCSDGGGLFLLVNPNDSKYWRLKYRFAGKEKVLALGVYPDVTLREAREGRIAARKLLKDGRTPAQINGQLILRLGLWFVIALRPLSVGITKPNRLHGLQAMLNNGWRIWNAMRCHL